MNFNSAPFGSLFSVSQKNGLTRPKKDRGAGLPMVNMGELFAHPRIKNIAMDLVPVSKTESGFLLEDGDLLFARQSLVLSGAGQCSIFMGNSSPTVFESHIIRCRLNHKNSDPRFYFYFFRSQAGRTVMETIVEQGAGASGIRGSDLVKLPVPAPGKETQKAIADFLTAVDDRIGSLRETNATLEAIAQALFKSWFVDFDPVRAKASGWESEGLNAEVAGLFPDGFEDDASCSIPKGWTIGTLGSLSNLNPESWSSKNHPETVAYIDLANAKENQIAVVTEYPFGDAPSRARRVLRYGDTIVGTVRPGNRSFAFIGTLTQNLTGSTGFAVLRPSAPQNAEFVYLAATADASIEYLAHVADGGAYPAVRPEVVAGLQCINPSPSVMQAFHAIAAPIFDKVSANQKHMETLSVLRDAMLPPLISGQLRLPEAETLLQDAA